MNRNATNELGQFVRVRKLWDGSDWNDGYRDNRGRFRVYRPDYPRAYSEGYALRAHVVYWMAKGRVHPKGTDLHHINEIKDDDRIENLKVIKHGRHTILHCKKEGVKLICEGCGRTYEIKEWRIKQRKKSGSSSRFCCLRCCWNTPRTKKSRINISVALKLAYKEGRR